MTFRDPRFPGAKLLDAHQIQKPLATTVRLYQKAAKPFTDYLYLNGLDPVTPEEWDDALVEFKNIDPNMTKSKFETLVSSIEFVFPRLKHNLKWAHSVLAGWNRAHITKHTVPCTRGVASLLALHIKANGAPRLAVGCVLQQRTGLRPGEMLGVCNNHVIDPGVWQHLGASPYFVIYLGVKAGTKAKRPQSVVLRMNENPDLYFLLTLLKQNTGPEDRLFPHTLEDYNLRLKDAQACLGVDLGITPHSPRAGFASESIALGRSFTETREGGRWLSDSNLRVYVDVVAAADISVQLQTIGLAPAQAWAIKYFAHYFKASDFNVAATRSRWSQGFCSSFLSPKRR